MDLKFEYHINTLSTIVGSIRFSGYGYACAYKYTAYFDGILPKGPYLPCVSMAVGPFWQDNLDLGISCFAPEYQWGSYRHDCKIGDYFSGLFVFNSSDGEVLIVNR